MNIKEVSQHSGLSAKTIRYYEAQGIITPPARSANNYREYAENHINELIIIKRAKMVGFSLAEASELLVLSSDPKRCSAAVKAKTELKIAEIDAQIAELNAMRHTLNALSTQCPGDNKPDCPILEALQSDNGL
ncbi:Cu(I)-responsive transcriptional regulator [Suttonella sp. R2A3]|uniref:Cu(I)-responsive transcriptional regulator n=1 Tax=Suttonella sp. R2A3 TaxID=2908648 RepID=UPI001F1A6509|nr:Cu(I)-responsive transcriptional regulator [Suttonella sp. R2A3]UJF24396.1 Cu(I)-responsive transcriptional regulator [Suttonella sp. R2A3]